LPHAVGLARALGYGVALLQVLPKIRSAPPGWSLNQPYDQHAQHRAEIEAGRTYLAEVARRWAAADLPITIEVVNGDPAHALLAYLDGNKHTPLVAMATHGRGGLGRLIFGSVVEQVLAQSPVPVLVVRAESDTLALDPPTYRTILVPLDGSSCAEAALAEACAIARPSDARLVLVSVLAEARTLAANLSQALTTAVRHTLTGPVGLPTKATIGKDVDNSAYHTIERYDDYLAMHAERLRAAGITVAVKRAHGNPPREIRSAAVQHHADLLVMTTHGREDLFRHWQTDVAPHVLGTAHLPILFVRVSNGPGSL